MKQRNIMLDVMRGIAIIFVVLGHAGVSSYVWSFIYSFHMPLFFFISGYFCNTNIDFKTFLKKKIKGLYFPFFKYYVLFIIASPILHRFLLTKNNYTSIDSFLSALFLSFRFRVGAIDLLGQFWFLPVLFFVTLLVYSCVKIFNQLIKREYSYLLLGGAVLSIIGGIGMKCHWYAPYDLYGVLYFSFYYLIGWCFHQFLDKVNKMKILFIPSFVILLFYSYFKNEMGDLISLKIVIAILGIVMTIIISNYLSHIPLCAKILQYVGSHTMPIYVWHVFIFKVLEFIISHLWDKHPMSEGWSGCYGSQSWYLVLSYSIVGVCIPILFHNIIKTCKK